MRADLDKIAALKSLRDLATFLGQADLTTVGNELLFGFGSSQDYADSSRVIGFLTAGGLGLPDRDYYVKTDAKSQEIRQRYVEHVQKMLELAGEPAAQAKTDAQTVMEIETALAKASHDARRSAGSAQLIPSVYARKTAETYSRVSLESLFRGVADSRSTPQCH